MSAVSIDAGRLIQRLEILALTESAPGVWTWQRAAGVKGRVEPSKTRNLFSAVGIGARGVEIIIRRRAITLHNAMVWTDFLTGRRQPLFLTDIAPQGRLHLKLQAAVVNPVTCTAERTSASVGSGGRPVTAENAKLTFPGVLTEKYARYEREETHAENDTSYVLVTPKPVELKAGDLVTVGDGPAKAVYNVTVCHVLDEWKNEYEIVWRRDV